MVGVTASNSFPATQSRVTCCDCSYAVQILQQLREEKKKRKGKKKRRITIEELSGLWPLYIFLCTRINHEERKKEKLQPKKNPHYITYTSFLFSFFEVGLERTKGLELFNDIMPGQYCTWGSISSPQRGFNSTVTKCFLVCRQGMNMFVL